MTYDPLTRTFKIYSEDTSLIGFYPITVEAYLEEYPTVRSPVAKTTQIEIIDPCLSPFSLKAPAQVDPEPYDYEPIPAVF